MAEILGTALRTAATLAKRLILAHASGAAYSVTALTANGTIGEYTPPVVFLTPDANRNLDFTADVEVAGSCFLLGNSDATYTVTVRDSAAATVVALKPKEFGVFVHNGTTWKFMQAQVGTLTASLLASANTWALAQTFTSGMVGNVTGNVTGNLTGNVTGDVTGNTSGTAGALASGATFFSTQQTGTGSSQDIAHGLGSTPRLVFAIPDDIGGGGVFSVSYGAHDATNVKVTFSNGQKYRIVAIK